MLARNLNRLQDADVNRISVSSIKDEYVGRGRSWDAQLEEIFQSYSEIRNKCLTFDNLIMVNFPKSCLFSFSESNLVVENA